MNASCIQNRRRGPPTPAIGGVGCAGEGSSVEARNAAERRPGSALPTTAPAEDDPVVPVHSESLTTKEMAARPPVVGAPEIADAKAWDWVTVRATRGFRASQGQHAVEMEVTPVGMGRRRVVGDTRKSNNADRTSLRCGREHPCGTLTLLLNCTVFDVSIPPT